MPLNIIIVGAGIGGPAAAVGLARNGHQVSIYERATNTSEVGYAFRITPNSDLCLKYLGVDSVAGGAVAANTVRMLDTDGRIVMERRENADSKKAAKKGGTSVFAYRVCM
jgi:salicylate hydroxylase